MDLWIRSQNREKLVSVNEINLYDKNIIKNDFILYGDPEHYDISIIANDNYNLGTYKTRERALEVLDEIQSKFKIICNDSTGGEYMLAKNLIPIIYEMPEE